MLDRYRVQLDRQQRLVALARYVSPAILMQDALNDVSQMRESIAWSMFDDAHIAAEVDDAPVAAVPPEAGELTPPVSREPVISLDVVTGTVDLRVP